MSALPFHLLVFALSLSVPLFLYSNRSISSFFDEYDSFTAMLNRTIALAWAMCTALYIALVHDFVGDTLHSYDNISYVLKRNKNEKQTKTKTTTTNLNATL